MPRKTGNCFVPGCNTKVKQQRYTIFPVPKCTETLKLWRRALRMKPDEEFLDTYGVCELHFHEDFIVRDNQQTWLMPGAVPELSVKQFTQQGGRCRMCGKSQKTPMTNTVTQLKKDIHLLPILDICLDLESTSHKRLPTEVCDPCTSMVRFIAKFAKGCWKAQDELLIMFNGGKGNKVQPWKRILKHSGHATSKPEKKNTTLSTLTPAEASSSNLLVQPAAERNTGSTSLVGQDAAYSLGSAEMLVTEETVVKSISVKHETSSGDGPLEFIIVEPVDLIKPEPMECAAESLKGPLQEKNTSELAPPIVIKDNCDIKPDCPMEPEDQFITIVDVGCTKAMKTENANTRGGLRARNYECCLCLTKLNSQGSLDLHLRQHFNFNDKKQFIEKVFKCSQCNEIFQTTAQLNKHAKQT